MKLPTPEQIDKTFSAMRSDAGPNLASSLEVQVIDIFIKTRLAQRLHTNYQIAAMGLMCSEMDLTISALACGFLIGHAVAECKSIEDLIS